MTHGPIEIRLCDNAGMVSDEPVEPGSPGTVFDAELTYRKLHNNLRAQNGDPDARKPHLGEPYACTGSGHMAGLVFRCTSPAHGHLIPPIYGERFADDLAAVRPAIPHLATPATNDGTRGPIVKLGGMVGLVITDGVPQCPWHCEPMTTEGRSNVWACPTCSGPYSAIRNDLRVAIHRAFDVEPASE